MGEVKRTPRRHCLVSWPKWTVAQSGFRLTSLRPNNLTVIASGAKQSSFREKERRKKAGLLRRYRSSQ